MVGLERLLKDAKPIRRGNVGQSAFTIVYLTQSSQYYGRAMTSIRLLHEAGMDVNWWGGDLIVMAASSDIAGKMVDRLLSYGANPNLTRSGPNDGLTALVAAIYGKRPTNAYSLLKAGANPNHATAEHGFIPLSAAAIKGDTTNVKLLLKYGAKIDAQHRKTKMTALHEAAANDRDDGIKILLAAGAKTSLRDAKGFTPLQLARRLNKPNAVRALRGRWCLQYPVNVYWSRTGVWPTNAVGPS